MVFQHIIKFCYANKLPENHYAWKYLVTIHLYFKLTLPRLEGGGWRVWTNPTLKYFLNNLKTSLSFHGFKGTVREKWKAVYKTFVEKYSMVFATNFTSSCLCYSYRIKYGVQIQIQKVTIFNRIVNNLNKFQTNHSDIITFNHRFFPHAFVYCSYFIILKKKILN